MGNKQKLKATLAPMSNKQKVEYIWSYYKWYFIIAIIFLIIVAMVINNFTSKKEDAFHIMVLAVQADSSKLTDIQNELNDLLLKKEERETSEVNIQVMPFSSNTGMDLQIAALQRVTGEIAASNLHVLLIDEEQFRMMNTDEYFIDLQGLVNNKIEIDKEHLYYSTDNSYITGINISALPLFSGAIYDKNLVLCIPKNGVKDDYTEKFLSYILSKNE
ncbi:hypothetical protein OEV98_02370 [Caldibacillus lycopersici]|uniref:Uncharacterized protein n=1 Tax=Perspicuibacillus lycopersici TaxID=1325689 RepID=A0AAE3IQ86_9BACI|nr:hypothetical protein [Perspicuibacillus lycopersici]MCU9612406.1 hypothetical protein [Perspicuibacillus lycopersici]